MKNMNRTTALEEQRNQNDEKNQSTDRDIHLFSSSAHLYASRVPTGK